jgi:cytochrome P460
MKLAGFVITAIMAAAIGPTATAGPEEVKLPENYQVNFVAYLDVDRYDRKRVRRMYVNPEALEAAVAGQPAPDGTILIMEDHDAVLGADEALRFDDNGRFIPKDAVSNIFVMEKNSAWSTANGNWDYAWYGPDGKPSTSEFAQSMDGCFACHANRSGRDFTFTFWKFVKDR